jgi:DNA-binding LacI/PurR family transcriptional regulator
MALGALRALADRGRRVPEDVAVVGFDDVADAADYRPPLTTLRQDFDGLGRAAIASLVAYRGRPCSPPVLLTPGSSSGRSAWEYVPSVAGIPGPP